MHVALGRLLVGAHRLRPSVLGVDAFVESVRRRILAGRQGDGESRIDATKLFVVGIDAQEKRVASAIVAVPRGRRIVGI